MPNNPNPSQKNCNFYIKFLDNFFYFYHQSLTVTAPENWKAAVNQPERYSNEIYLWTTQEVTLQPSGSEEASITVTMTYTKAVSATRTAFAVDARVFITSQVTTDGSPIPSHQDISLILLESEGLPIPLAAQFVGPRTILNDGTATHNLKLRIINPLPEPVPFEPPSTGGQTPTNIRVRVQLSNEITADWALCKPDEANDLSLSVCNTWTQTSSSNETEKSWEIQPDYSQIQQIEGNSVLELTLSDVKSSLAPGFTDVFVDFQNFPVFGTQTKIVQIEKSPLIYSGKSIGIGITAPEESLHIRNGSLRIDTGEIRSNGAIVFCSDVDNTGDSESVKFLRQTYNAASPMTPIPDATTSSAGTKTPIPTACNCSKTYRGKTYRGKTCMTPSSLNISGASMTPAPPSPPRAFTTRG